MHYAVEAHTNVDIYALFLPMNALCRVVEIGCTISEIRADCLYFAGKRCIDELPAGCDKHLIAELARPNQHNQQYIHTYPEMKYFVTPIICIESAKVTLTSKYQFYNLHSLMPAFFHHYALLVALLCN